MRPSLGLPFPFLGDGWVSLSCCSALFALLCTPFRAMACLLVPLHPVTRFKAVSSFLAHGRHRLQPPTGLAQTQASGWDLGWGSPLPSLSSPFSRRGDNSPCPPLLSIRPHPSDSAYRGWTQNLVRESGECLPSSNTFSDRELTTTRRAPSCQQGAEVCPSGPWTPATQFTWPFTDEGTASHSL